MRKNDYQAFAGSFLDLWQEQVARAMSDTDFLQALMENMQQMQSGMFGYDAPHKNHFDTADASEPKSDELDDMQRRLAAAERKIIKLEATIERLRDAKPAAKPVVKSAAKKAVPKKTAAKPKRIAKPKPATKPAKPAVKTAAVKAKPAAKPKAKAKPTARKRAVKRR